MRHSCLEIYSKNSFSRERKERSKNPVSIREFANIIDKEATVQHQPRLTMKGSKVSPLLPSLSLSFSLSWPRSDSRLWAFSTLPGVRRPEGTRPTCPITTIALSWPRESLHRGRLSADLDGNCSETTEETTLETGIPRYNEPRCRNGKLTGSPRGIFLFSPSLFSSFFLTCKLQGGIKIAREAMQLTAFLRVYASDFRGCVGPRYTRNGYT